MQQRRRAVTPIDDFDDLNTPISGNSDYMFMLASSLLVLNNIDVRIKARWRLYGTHFISDTFR